MNRHFLKFILVGLLILGAASWSALKSSEARMSLAIVGSGVPSGATYPDIIFYWGMEGNTAEHSHGDASATYNETAVLSTDQKVIGAKSLFCVDGDDYAAFDISSNDIIHTTEGTVGIYFYPTAFANYASVFVFASSPNDQCILYYSSSRLQFAYKANGNTISATLHGTTLSANTWYFVQAWWSISKALPSGRSLQLTLYDIDGTEVGTTVGSTDTLSEWGTAPNILYVGIWGGYNAQNYLDQIFSSNDITRDLRAIRDCTNCY